jgi:hypothetical protein
MQVLCKASNTASDIRCSVCGQGFLVYWTRSSREEQASRRAEIVNTLRAHHDAEHGAAAHPSVGFHLPEWQGDPQYSAASLINARAWAA